MSVEAAKVAVAGTVVIVPALVVEVVAAAVAVSAVSA